MRKSAARNPNKHNRKQRARNSKQRARSRSSSSSSSSDGEDAEARRAAEWFAPNVTLSGAHFRLFNDAYSSVLDLAEIARHIWGCEVTTHDAIASESASLKEFMQQQQGGGGGSGTTGGAGGAHPNIILGPTLGAATAVKAKGPKGRPTAAAAAAAALSEVATPYALSSSVLGGGAIGVGSALVGGGGGGGAGQGHVETVLRIRFPRTIAFREREVQGDAASSSSSSSSSSEDEAEAPMLTTEDLPQLSVLSTLHDGFGGVGGSMIMTGSLLGGGGGGGGFDNQIHVPSATPIFASTVAGFGAGASGGDVPLSQQQQSGRQQQQQAFNLSSNVMQSSLFGMGGGGGGGGFGGNLDSLVMNSATHGGGRKASSSSLSGGGSSGFSELYQSVLTSNVHGGGMGGPPKDALNAEATVDDLMALTAGGGGGGGGSGASSFLQQQQHDVGGATMVPPPAKHSMVPPPPLFGDGAPSAPLLGAAGAASDSGGMSGSLFDLASRFNTTKIELSQQQQQQPQGLSQPMLLTAADLLLESDGTDGNKGGKRGRRRATEDASAATANNTMAASRRTIVERVVFESIFCTVSRRGAVSVFGPIPIEELAAVCQMAHEYLARAILSSCPWCVSLSATTANLNNSSRNNGATSIGDSPHAAALRLPAISPKEMIVCGSAASWHEHAKERLAAERAKRAAAAEDRRLKAEAEAAKIAAATALTPLGDDEDEEDTDGFALPFALPAKRKPSSSSLGAKMGAPPQMNPTLLGGGLLGGGGGGGLGVSGLGSDLAPLLPTASSNALSLSVSSIGPDILETRLDRLRVLLSVPTAAEANGKKKEGEDVAGEADAAHHRRPVQFPGLLPSPLLGAAPDVGGFIVLPALRGDHEMRVTNIMCHLTWGTRAAAALCAARGGGVGAKKGSSSAAATAATRPKHFTVAEFEAFTANVGKWAMMRRRKDIERAERRRQEGGGEEGASGDGKKPAPPRAVPVKVQMKHPASATFTSSAVQEKARTSLAAALTGGRDGDGWAPKGVVIVLAATQDYCRFEWNYDGRATEVVANRRSATLRVIIAKTAEDCAYIGGTLVPVCLGLL